LTEDAIKKSALMIGVSTEELELELEMKELIIDCTKKGLLSLCCEFFLSPAAGFATQLSLPVLGGAIAGIMSYKSTSYCMTKIRQGMYEDSLKINMKLSILLAQSSSV
jgi:hypothetical protein